MIIYFYLFILLLFLSADSSSIRSRSFKNELVPFLSSRTEPSKKDPNSLKVVSNEPFIIQLQLPNSVQRETKRNDEKKRKRPDKKRMSKTKALRKKNRRRRDLLTSKTKPQQEKSNNKETQNAVNKTEHHLKNFTKNLINRMEILKALSSYSKIIENRRNLLEGIKNAEKNYPEKHANLHKHNWLFSERTPYEGMVYPSTPKFDESQQKYSYKDLVADRERLEQKIRYVKNMLNVNVTTPDDSVRVRRRSDSDRTANKIAKMFLTLSAVNGLHDRRKPKCEKDDEDEEEVWDKERRNNPTKKSVSSNEERYKVKKWIEFIKNKRSSGKTCPCMTNANGEDADIFPLEQKLSKDYYYLERERSSEESTESDGDSFYYSRDKLENNSKRMFLRSPEQENKLKVLTKNGKKKLGLPINDLEQYRSRAKQILQNAEEILDRIKEEEERRLATPSIFVNHLRELTSRIQGDPRNNENELIHKIQKNIGWAPLAKTIEGTEDHNFMDKVKSLILDPYEKAKALTDESTKRLSSYLLRNLGKLEESSEDEKETIKSDDDAHKEEIQIFFEQTPQKEEKPISASLAKEQVAYAPSNNREDSQKREDTARLSTVVVDDEADDEKDNLRGDPEEPFKQKVEDIIKAQQKKLDEYKVKHYSGENGREIDNFDETNVKEATQPMKNKQLEEEVVEDTKYEKNREQIALRLKGNESEDKKQAPQSSESTKIEETKRTSSETKENVAATETENLDFIKKKKNSEKVEIPGETDVTAAENMREEKEFEAEIEKILKTKNEKAQNTTPGERETNSSEENENDTTALKEGDTKNENMMAQDLQKPIDQGRSTEQVQSSEEESEKSVTSSIIQETNFREKTKDPQNENIKERGENFLSSPYDFYKRENAVQTLENLNADLKGSSNEEESNAETSSEKLERYETGTNEEDLTKLNENNYTQKDEEFLETSQSTLMKDSSELDQDGLLIDKSQQNPSNDEITQTENGQEKPFLDVVQETSSKLEEPLEESYPVSTENTLKNNDKPDTESLTLKSTDFKDDLSKQKAGDLSRISLDVEDEQEKLQEILNKNELTAPSDEQNPENSNKDNEKKNSDDNIEENLKLENQGNFESANEDDNVKAVNPENQKNESLEISPVESEKDVPSQASKITEETSNESLDKNRSKEINLKTVLDEENLEDGVSRQGDETLLSSQINEKNSRGKEVSVEDGSEKALYSNENSSEIFLKTHLNKNQDSDQKNYDETNPDENENENENHDNERENSLEDSDKTLLKAEQDEEIYNEKDAEKILKSIKADDDGDDQGKNEKNENFNEKGSSETSIKKEPESLMERGETSEEDLKNTKESLKNKDKVTLTYANQQSNNLDENQSQMPLENNEEQNIEGSEETNLRKLKLDQSQENLKEVDVTLKSSQENQNRESSAAVDNDESSLMSKNPDADIRDQDVDQKSNDGTSEETSDVGKETEGKLVEARTDETLREANPNEESDRSQESTDETNLRAPAEEHVPNTTEGMDGGQKTNSKESEQEEDLIKDSRGSSLREVVANKQRATEIDNDELRLISKKNKSHKVAENLEEQDDNEIENDQTSNDEGNSFEESRENPLRSNLEGKQLGSLEKMDNEETLQEGNPTGQESGNLEKMDNEDTLQEINPGDQEAGNLEKMANEETLQEVNPGDQEAGNLEKMANEETLQEVNPRDQEAGNLEKMDNEDTLQEVNPGDQESGNLEKMDNEETLQDANPKGQEKEVLNKVEGDETPLRPNSEEKSNTKVKEFLETPLLSSKVSEEKYDNELESSSVIEGTDQENQDSNNQMNDENEKILLKSPRFEETKGYLEDSYETLRKETPSDENINFEEELEPDQTNSLVNPQNAQIRSSLIDVLQKSDFQPKPSKANKLKVPKSIGKIMEDLDGQEKDDITSIQNLNPDKIDHIIYKIDEAEQQNLLQNQEIDCRKECACADDIDNKSRTIGRYEIVKDFLHWMKDLQLNRVLSDD